MKILHVLAQLPQKTGSGVYFTNLIEGLREKGEENALIYGVQKPLEVEFPYKTYPVEFLTEELPFPIAGMSDEMPYENTVYSKMTDKKIDRWKKAFQIRLERAKREFSPDIVIAHHLWFLTSLALDVFEDIPVVGISHGTDIRQAEKNHHLKVQHVHHLNRLAHIFALSKKDIPLIEKTFAIAKEKIQPIGGGFNHRIFHANRSPKKDHKIRIMYAGKLSRSKGVFELTKAYPNLKRKFPEIKMYVIGNAEEHTKEILYENAHFKKDFRIFNTKTQKKLAEIMRRCDIFVLPSYYEGLGLIAIEALACKMRVVATEIEGLMELLGDDVNQSDILSYVKMPRLFDVDKPLYEDIDSFVMRLEEALEEQILRVRSNEPFPDEIYQKIEQHSWREIIQTEYDMICRLVSSPDKKN